MKKLKHIQLIALLAFSFIFQLAAAQDTTQQITPGRFNSATAQKKTICYTYFYRWTSIRFCRKVSCKIITSIW